MQLFVLFTALLVFSAMFLADALRRLSKALKKDNKMVVNQKTMCLHVTALLMHTIVIVSVQYVTVYSFENPKPKTDLILNISRICLFGS